MWQQTAKWLTFKNNLHTLHQETLILAWEDLLRFRHSIVVYITWKPARSFRNNVIIHLYEVLEQVNSPVTEDGKGQEPVQLCWNMPHMVLRCHTGTCVCPLNKNLSLKENCQCLSISHSWGSDWAGWRMRLRCSQSICCSQCDPLPKDIKKKKKTTGTDWDSSWNFTFCCPTKCKVVNLQQLLLKVTSQSPWVCFFNPYPVLVCCS